METTDTGGQNDNGLTDVVDFSFCRDHKLFVSNDQLFCTDATKPEALIEFRRRLGKSLPVQILTATAFEAAFDSHFVDSVLQTDDEEDVIFEFAGSGQEGERIQDLMESSEDAPVIELVNQIFRRAIRSNASDVHIEPAETGMRVRMRINGILTTVIERPDAPAVRIISRLKVMAGLDTSETRRPQDGRIGLRFGGRAIDIRFSSMGALHGERLVLRILDRRRGLRTVEDLGLGAADRETLNRILQSPNGIFLVVGPTGSGKTTTLYSLLNELDKGDRNIITIEDPVEYEFPTISQTQVNADIGVTFVSGLRTSLRQDPDVILVGEIRDPETAAVAAQAALTGHLVLSSLHADGCIKAITRLRNLDLNDHLIASTLRGILAQRLVRKICHACNNGEGSGTCLECNGTGYSERIGTFELCEIDANAARAIEVGTEIGELGAAIMRDQPTMMQNALAMVARGETTEEEITRVFGNHE